MENLLTRSEVAALLRVTTRTVDTYVTDGRLDSVKLSGKARRFEQEAVDAFIRRAGDIRTRQEQEGTA